MDHAKQTLAVAERIVAMGRRHVARQREIVAELGGVGRDAEVARELLATFEILQEEHGAHRDRLRAELGIPEGELLEADRDGGPDLDRVLSGQ